MTVADLIAQLQRCPPDARVVFVDDADVVSVTARTIDADGGHDAIDLVVLSDCEPTP